MGRADGDPEGVGTSDCFPVRLDDFRLGRGRSGEKDLARAPSGYGDTVGAVEESPTIRCLAAVPGPSAIATALVSTRTEYGHLYSVYVPIAAGVFAIVLALVIGALLHYRGAGTPSRRNNATVLEGSYALLLVCVVGFLLYETFGAEHQVERSPTAKLRA